jgi:hypothetical protein
MDVADRLWRLACWAAWDGLLERVRAVAKLVPGSGPDDSRRNQTFETLAIKDAALMKAIRHFEDRRLLFPFLAK